MEIIKPNEYDSYDSYIKKILKSRPNFRDSENYLEKHHIIPKCIGGDDAEDNLIWLYAQEHFYAHKLLALENKHNNGLQFAFWNMCQCQKAKRKESLGDIIDAEDYELARKLFAQNMSNRFKGENNPMYGKSGELNPMFNVSHKEESKAKMSKYLSNRTKSHKEKLIKNHADFSGENNPNYGKPMSNELKKKISKARIGRYKGEDHPFSIKIQCVETGLVFYSIKSAVEWCGGNPHIYDCISNKRKSAGKHPETGEKLHWIKID